MLPYQQDAARDQPRHDARQDVSLHRGGDIGEHQIPTQDEVKVPWGKGFANILLQETHGLRNMSRTTYPLSRRVNPASIQSGGSSRILLLGYHPRRARANTCLSTSVAMIHRYESLASAAPNAVGRLVSIGYMPCPALSTSSLSSGRGSCPSWRMALHFQRGPSYWHQWRKASRSADMAFPFTLPTRHPLARACSVPSASRAEYPAFPRR
jgi:hypothetical protein